MLEAGVDTKLKEEGVELSRGEEEGDGYSSKSGGGRNGLYGVSVSMVPMRRDGWVEYWVQTSWLL